MQHTYSASHDRGFSLIELLIVMAIIGILATIATSSYLSSVRKANEAAAVATLHTIKLAEAKYLMDRKGQYGTFQQLFEEGYLDKRFNEAQPVIRGYVFTIRLIPKSEGKVVSFAVNANPEQPDGVKATGKNFYYIDPDGGICFSRRGPATALDEML